MKLGNFARRETLLFSAGAIAHPLLSGCVSLPQPVRRMGGANLVETLEAPFGSASAAESLRKLAAIGASLVAITPSCGNLGRPVRTSAWVMRSLTIACERVSDRPVKWVLESL